MTVRFNQLEDGERIHEEIRAVGKQRSTRGVRFRVTGGIRRPPMVSTSSSEEFFQEVARVGKRIHVPLAEAHRWHSSDICFAVEEVPKIDGMGPIGFGERTENEHVLRSSLVDHAALLALVIRNCRK